MLPDKIKIKCAITRKNQWLVGLLVSGFLNDKVGYGAGYYNKKYGVLLERINLNKNSVLKDLRDTLDWHIQKGKLKIINKKV